MDFISHVVIGDNTPFTLNTWTGKIEDVWGNPLATARGMVSTGGLKPWPSQQGALAHAERLQSERQPGQDIFVVSHRALGEGDGPTRYTYFVTIARCDVFQVENEEN